MPWAGKLVLSLGAFGALGWMWYVNLKPEKPEIDYTQEEGPFLYCPNCHWQQQCSNPEMAKYMKCPRCFQGGLVYTTESHTAAAASTPHIVILSFVTVPLVLGVLWFLFAPGKVSGKRAVGHLSCPRCGRRIGFDASQKGRKGLCPRCKADLTLSASAVSRRALPEPAPDDARPSRGPPPPPRAVALSPAHNMERVEEPSPAAVSAPAAPVAAPATHPPPLPAERLGELAGQPLGHFDLDGWLGQSLRGAMFAATNTRNGEPVALKVFDPRFPASPEERQRFEQAMKLALPIRHPHLVPLLGAGKVEGYYWLAREFVEGESIDATVQRLGESHQGDWRGGLHVGLHVARALAFARDHGLSHGRVTPRNILWDKTARVARLADLMLEEALEGSALGEATRTRRLPEELPYLAPEQAGDGQVDERTDLFGVGAVMYALFTGRPPFEGDDPLHTLVLVRAADAEPIANLNPQVPPELVDVVTRLLAFDPAERYAAAGELVAELESIAQSHPLPV